MIRISWGTKEGDEGEGTCLELLQIVLKILEFLLVAFHFDSGSLGQDTGSRCYCLLSRRAILD